ncbi:TPA: VIT1/CCC1 transporter family protein [Streptococcus pneumoniae]
MDSNFAGRLNILRAGVLDANDGIISIAGVVIGVASATTNIWIIFLSGFTAILAGAFSMAGGEYVSVSTPKDTEEAAVSSFVAFFLRSLPPMLSVTIFPSDYRIPATVLIVGVALLLTGYTSARLGKAPTKTAMIRNLAIGLLTMGVTFLLEQLFSI